MEKPNYGRSEVTRFIGTLKGWKKVSTVDREKIDEMAKLIESCESTGFGAKKGPKVRGHVQWFYNSNKDLKTVFGRDDPMFVKMAEHISTAPAEVQTM